MVTCARPRRLVDSTGRAKSRMLLGEKCVGREPSRIGKGTVGLRYYDTMEYNARAPLRKGISRRPTWARCCLSAPDLKRSAVADACIALRPGSNEMSRQFEVFKRKDLEIVMFVREMES